MLELRMDDIFYVFCAALNGVHYRYVGKLYYTNMRPISSPDGLSDENKDSSNELMRKYLVGKIISNYHINMEKINRPYFADSCRVVIEAAAPTSPMYICIAPI